MITIAIVNLKGGVGKSTVALNLAACLSGSAHVLLVDADPQGSCLNWAARRKEIGRDGVDTTFAEGAALRELVNRASAYDVAILDTPPQAGATAKFAMAEADLVLIPCGPGPTDAWATHETVRAFERMRALRPELLGALLLNRTDRTSIGRESARALAGFGVPILEASIANRVAFAEATAEGLGVTEHAPRSEAAMDVRRVTRVALALVGVHVDIEVAA